MELGIKQDNKNALIEICLMSIKWDSEIIKLEFAEVKLDLTNACTNIHI